MVDGSRAIHATGIWKIARGNVSRFLLPWDYSPTTCNIFFLRFSPLVSRYIQSAIFTNSRMFSLLQPQSRPSGQTVKITLFLDYLSTHHPEDYGRSVKSTSSKGTLWIFSFSQFPRGYFPDSQIGNRDTVIQRMRWFYGYKRTYILLFRLG